jgi:predicted nucleic acid-binding protein
MPNAFVDTNILVYAAEELLPLTEKTRIARELLRQPGLAVSVQVLGEFIVSARHPKKLALPPTSEAAWLALFMRMDIAPLTPETLILALRLHGAYQTSHWDSLVLASALELGCPRIYSEDLNHGQDYDGVRVVNPFL